MGYVWLIGVSDSFRQPTHYWPTCTGIEEAVGGQLQALPRRLHRQQLAQCAVQVQQHLQWKIEHKLNDAPVTKAPWLAGEPTLVSHTSAKQSALGTNCEYHQSRMERKIWQTGNLTRQAQVEAACTGQRHAPASLEVMQLCQQLSKSLRCVIHPAT